MKNIIGVLLIILLFTISCSKEIMGPIGDAVSLVISPVSLDLNKGDTYRFSVCAYDKNNNYISITPTWSVESNYGVINNKGYFYVKNDITAPYPKTEYVVVTYNGLTARAKVTIKLGDFWIFSDVNTQDFMYDYPDPRPDFGGKLGTWDNCSLSDDTSDYPENGGNKSLKIEYTGAGGAYWLFCSCGSTGTNMITNSSYAEDLTSYTNDGKLEFWVKSTNNLEIKIEDYFGGASSKYLSGYITLKNEWQKVSIPLKEFTGVDFSKIKTIVGFHSTTAGIAHIDEVQFTAE